MTFRTTLLLGILAILGGVLAITALTISLVIERSAREEVNAGIARAHVVVRDRHAQRQTLLDAEARVLAEEPRLKAVVSTQSISRETVVGVANDLNGALQAEVFVLTDGSGKLLVDVHHADADGDDLSENAVVAKALAQGQGAGVWIDGDNAFQVEAHRLSFGATTVGVLVIGYRWDDRVADLVQKETGSALAVVVDGRVVASPTREEGRPVDRGALAAAIAGVPAGEVPTEVRVGGVEYMAGRAPLPGYVGKKTTSIVVLHSLDRALAPSRSLKRILYTVMFAGILGAAIFAALLARRIAQPIDRLVAFTRDVARGARAKVVASGPRELQLLGTAMNEMAEEIVTARQQAVERERLSREMKIAERIQTGVLPKDERVAHFLVGARMVPASEVGGDYYDLVRTSAGCWIGIGDVSGHGLIAGLSMLMVQSMFAVLCRHSPTARPSAHLSVLNAALFENLHRRLKRDDHMTLTMLHAEPDGRVVYAGAHEDIIVLRAKAETCELVETPGPWVGARPHIENITSDHELTLAHGDLIVLYSDGITEARNATREQFGLRRLCAVVEASRALPVQAIADEVISAVSQWTSTQDDDRTIVVLRADFETRRDDATTKPPMLTTPND